MIAIEVACNGYQSALNAFTGGAHRIELFENISEGGCTPSAGMIHLVNQLPLPVFVMIRPRGGDFCYTSIEIDMMLHDIEICKLAKVAGIVFGCLNKSGEVDKSINQLLLNAWGGKATFHRAIDRSSNIINAAHAVADLGFERILSSGGAQNVSDGLVKLKQMQDDIGHLIDIMPGAGVTASNAKQIIKYTNCNALHSTCKITQASNLGVMNSLFNETVQIAGVEAVRALVASVL